jgi:AcrR family transcriptional regulator
VALSAPSPGPERAAVEAPRRRLSARQADVVNQLVEAATAETEAVGYDGLTVRNVARRAGVAPATAYTYFSAKDHLLAEVLWRHLQHLAPVGDPAGRPLDERLRAAVGSTVVFAAESPTLAEACTAALLSTNADVRALQDRIGALIGRRLAEAVGRDADPRVVPVLQAAYFGALLTAGMGHIAYLEVPDLVVTAADLMVGTDPGPGPSSATAPGEAP